VKKASSPLRNSSPRHTQRYDCPSLRSGFELISDVYDTGTQRM
jgi:hypothetical protein